MNSTMMRIKAAGALAPLAVLSMGVTVSLLAPTVPVVVAWDGGQGPISIPQVDKLDAPASSTRPAQARRGGVLVRPAVARTASDIPSAALAAYQRAAAVMGSADSSCQLPWELLAAIGKVESNHGRFGGGRLDNAGRARPAIIGVRLNGKHHTAAIRDTDAGEIDGDAKWDRAVGPMQFIPSTWSVVGVDSDGDGRRDPQDIDDAALGAAVYLCAGDGDLARAAGRKAALLRYNHSREYVRLVLKIFRAYQAAETPVPVAVLRVDAMPVLSARAAPAPHRKPKADKPDKLAPVDQAPEAPESEEPASEQPEEPAPEEPSGEEPAPDPDPTTEPDPTECVPPVEEPTGDPTGDPVTEPEPAPEGEPAPGEEPGEEPGCSTPGDPSTEPEPTPEPEPSTEPEPTPSRSRSPSPSRPPRSLRPCGARGARPRLLRRPSSTATGWRPPPRRRARRAGPRRGGPGRQAARQPPCRRRWSTQPAPRGR